MTTRSGKWTVAIDGKKLAAFMKGEQGPVYRRFARAAQVVKQGARRQVGVFSSPDAYTMSHRQRRPGTLRDSIVTRVIDNKGLPLWVIGSDDPIARIHHEGIPGGIVIYPRTAPYLVFYWPKMGRVVAFKSVVQGAIKPNRYLTDQLPAAVAIIRSA